MVGGYGWMLSVVIHGNSMIQVLFIWILCYFIPLGLMAAKWVARYNNPKFSH